MPHPLREERKLRPQSGPPRLTTKHADRELDAVREFGGYTLTHRLGIGGMGEVWKGQREALGGAAVHVAIKLLTAARTGTVDARRMFLDEARLSMLLNSSNIVKVYDAAETEDGICYLIMEWVDGLNLAQLSEKLHERGENLPDVIIGYIIGEVLKGLAHAHDLRDGARRITIVHRDVSPHNVMLSTSGEVKLMDFGIARIASEETSGAHVKGKLRYMPPEQLRGESREPTLDLFAVGAMLHELLDRDTFRGRVVDEARLYGMVLDGEIPTMTRARQTVPNELDELREQLLAVNATDRIQSAREAFVRLCCWPEYRDARFELDEIVRRFGNVGESEDPRHVPYDLEAPTVVFVADGSETAAGRRRQSTTAAPAPTHSRRALAALVLGCSAAGFAGVCSVVAQSGQGDIVPEVVSAESTRSLAVVPPTTEPIGSTDGTDDGVEPDLVRSDIEDIEPRLDLPDLPDLPDENDLSARVHPTPTPTPRKTKVFLVLSDGVPWAEIKIGGRSFVLDAFGRDGASTRLAPGSYNTWFRTRVDAPWSQAGRIVVSGGLATVTLDKHGDLLVQ
ncbi:serine/threonine protein kinase [Enhygromyxa salina]|uniref:Serine/threonine protein kinase n=1 Tax=Enhygromyxa salina TaxID=215803 RepID=A0A0C1ZM62_9BACT|nr:serine/threonine-protein kinase [Enhygromyxa salina]KIG12003.1 serine/threonine protein kinase [Enhygromyxa salina]